MKRMVSGRATFTELYYSKRRQTYTVESPPHSEIWNSQDSSWCAVMLQNIPLHINWNKNYAVFFSCNRNNFYV